MALEPQTITVENKFYLDGRGRGLGTSNIFYIGFAHSPFDLVIPPLAENFEIPLENKGAIKKILLVNRSCDPVYFKLNGSEERFIIHDQAVLSQHPESLLIDNGSAVNNAVIEVTIISEEE